MLSPTRPAIPPRPRRAASRKQGAVEPQSPKLGSWREDINMNTTTSTAISPHHGYASNGPVESDRSRGVSQGRATVDQQIDSPIPIQTHKPNGVHLASDPGSALDPNCNEPSLPCLCCNGYSPQDNNSTYNLNYINNNTVTFGQQLQQTQSSGDESYQQNPDLTQLLAGKEVDKSEESEDTESRTEVSRDEYADEDDTLIPSCWDCPPSLLEFSLSSFASSSSTSISGCSDLESDCPDAISLSCQDFPPEPDHANYPLDAQPHTALLKSYPPLQSPRSPCSPDEEFPSAPSTTSTEGNWPLGQDDGGLDLQKLSNSVDELGKAIHRQAVQLARWDMEDYLGFIDELDHLEMNKSGLAGLKGVRFGLGEADLAKDMMGDLGSSINGETLSNPLDYSNTAVETSTSSDFDESLVPDSFASSPLLHPTQPPKLPASNTDMQAFTYMNMNASTPNAPTTSSISSSSPSFGAASLSFSSLPHEAEASSPSLSLPPSQPIHYFTLYSSTPSLSSAPPPIPPPRRKRQARLEALRKASNQDEGTPLPPPPPASQTPPLPPPLPPPANLHAPAALRRPHTSLPPPPPSFHALDDEIRKLLILAGVTQAELLKLGPELGVGVMELLEPGGGEGSQATEPGEPEGMEIRGGSIGARKGRHDASGMEKRRDVYRKSEREERLREIKGPGTYIVNRGVIQEGVVEGQTGKNGREALRTASFTEMARRQGGNSHSKSFGHNSGCSSDAGFESYYSTTESNLNTSNLSYHNNNNSRSSIAPPPSRALQPCRPALPLPPPLPRPNLTTVPANKFRPERFDWLIAFSPDTDTLSRPCAVSKVLENGMQRFAAGAEVTTFKELRSQSRQNPLPPMLHKESDPTVLTPDPDFLYSLKCTSEIDGEGCQWETSTQAQTSVLQPPPVTPLAPLKVMLPTSRGEPLTRPYPLIGCSAGENRLQTTVGSEREEDEATVRGRADGGMVQESSATACSLPRAEPVQRGGALRADVVRAHLGGQGSSSPCQQEKRALLSPISMAVDAILAQFTSSRTLVQKVQSGDSRVNPSLGRLVLQCLCPALNGLLSDGLKPYQTDLIAGRRPNSPWGLVQASTGPGPSTQALHSLQCQVSQLPQLRQSRHRFNAFLLGLLNIKLLDHWIFHLQSCDDVLETHYRPTSFMWLSRTSCQPLFEELLLLLQPLSLLTLNLDLLFQHHNFDPASPTPSPANYSWKTSSLANQACSLRIKGLSCWRSGQLGTSEKNSGVLKDKHKTKLAILPNNRNNGLNWPANARPGQGLVAAKNVLAPNQIPWKEKKMMPPSVGTLPQQAGQAVQQGLGSVVQWGGKLGQGWGSSNKAGQVMSAEEKARSLPQDSWSRTAHTESEYTTHKAQRNPVPECNSVAPWVLGMLFGASRGQRTPQTCTLSARRPSHWLAPGASVFSRIVSPNQMSESEERGAESEWERGRESMEMRERPRPVRSVWTQQEHRARGQLY